ncbi:MMPL family transporter [Modestobacter sp. NPDC049651]|uniref:MMPL family transporter n=1 Tax=unclassified Modestobacter TaxID=2643866 RepID=UPI0033CC528D
MFARLGRFVVRHPWQVIAAWIVLAVAVVALAPKLTSTSDEAEFLPSHYESIQALDLQEQAFPSARTPDALIVVERRDGAPLTDADADTVTRVAAALTAEDVEHVEGITAVPPTGNRLVQLVAVQLPDVSSGSDTRATDAVADLRPALQDQLRDTDLRGGITGNAAQQLDAQDSGSRAEAIVGIATIGLIVVLLLVIFRSPIIALLPIVTIGLVSQVATGLIGWANEAFDLEADSSVTSILIVVLFGVGTDYILFLMFRYRERLRAGDDPKTAMVNAVARVGEAIASAAGAVIIAFLALLLSTLGLFRALGPALAISVAVTLVAGLTLIPAVVSLLGTRVFWPSKAWRSEPKGDRAAAIGTSLGRHPVRYVVASGGVLVLLAVFALGFSANFDLSAGSSDSTAESAVWQEELLKTVPAGATQPTDVYLRSDDGSRLDDGAVADFGARLAGVRGVGEVAPPQLSEDGAVADFSVTLADSPESKAALETVRGPLRDDAHAAAPAGTTALVGGITSVFVDIQSAMNRDYAVVFPVAAVLIMLILGALLRSVVAPWYLMAAVGLGFAATLGASVLVFQTIGSEPGLIFTLPLIMYLFVVALGTDYNILMVARLREEAQEGNAPRQAAAIAFRHAAPTVAAAGVILAGTFASLMLAGNSQLTQMGFAISVGIAIAAFVMAMFFVPALTALIGHRAWWPGHADARRPADERPAPEAEPARL